MENTVKTAVEYKYKWVPTGADWLSWLGYLWVLLCSVMVVSKNTIRSYPTTVRAFSGLSACAGWLGRQAASPLQILDACMQPRFKEFRKISSNTLCVPEPIFQQLDSWFSAMFVIASLLVDVVFRASSRVPSPRKCGEDCVTWNFLSRTRASSRLLELHAILHEPHCFPALRR